jgi:hypothetical protein
MAYLLTHFWPSGTEDQYRMTLAAIHPTNGLPAGQTYHAAGPTDAGYLIATVWDSQESADRFVKEVLMARMPVTGGFEGKPEERAAQISNAETQ